MTNYSKKTNKEGLRPGISYYTPAHDHRLVGKIKEQIRYMFKKNVQTTTIGKVMEERYRL